MLWALGSLGVTPEPAWLAQALHEAGRRQAQRQLLPQHLANIAWGLAKLGSRPDRAWLSRFQEDVFGALPAMKPQELTNVLWALAVLNCKAEQVRTPAALDNLRTSQACTAWELHDSDSARWAADREARLAHSVHVFFVLCF